MEIGNSVNSKLKVRTYSSMNSVNDLVKNSTSDKVHHLAGNSMWRRVFNSVTLRLYEYR